MIVYCNKQILLEFVYRNKHTPEKSVALLFLRDGRTVLVLVPEFNDMEPASVHVKVDVALQSRIQLIVFEMI